MQNLEYLFIKSRSYEEVLKKAYDLGKDLGFNYRQYLLKRCVEFDLLFKQLASESEDNYEVEKSQDKVLSFDDDDDYEDIFVADNNQSGVVPHTSHSSSFYKGLLVKEDFMLPKEVREYLNISKSSLKRLVKSEKLIPIGTGYDGTYYYLREDVEALKNR